LAWVMTLLVFQVFRPHLRSNKELYRCHVLSDASYTMPAHHREELVVGSRAPRVVALALPNCNKPNKPNKQTQACWPTQGEQRWGQGVCLPHSTDTVFPCELAHEVVEVDA
jgi:hypothetical protein